MKHFVCILFLLTFSTLSFSQYIEGKILDVQTKLPIEGVHVLVKGINSGTLTDENGNYFLSLSNTKVKTDTLVFSHIAYTTKEIPYTKNNINYSVYLIPNITNLNEIEIRNKITLNPSLKYKSLASMHKGVYSFGAVLSNHKIYVIGGNASFNEDNFKKHLDQEPDISFEDLLRKGSKYSKDYYNGNLQIYDIETNTWEKTALKFNEIAHHNILLNDNIIYIIGGKQISKNGKKEYLNNNIEVYNIKTKNQKIDKTNPHQAIDFASFTYNDNIVIMGGSTQMNKLGIKQYSSKIHLFEIKTGLWYEIGNMPEQKETQGILISNKFYLIGGYFHKAVNSVESYDITTGKWEKIGELFDEISKPALANNNNIIYIFDDGKITTFNVLTNELNQYYIDLYLKNAQLIYDNNKLYILGGYKNIIHSVYPSKKVFSVDIEEFEKTKIQQSKTL